MPIKKSNKPSNIINFPNNTPKEKPKEMTLEEKQRQHHIVMQTLEKNRAEGQKALEKRIENLDERPTLADPALESIVRDIQFGFKGILTAMESINTLISFLKNDMLRSLKHQDEVGAANFHSAALTQTLVTLLKNLNIITDEQLEKVWNELVPKMLGQTNTSCDGKCEGCDKEDC